MGERCDRCFNEELAQRLGVDFDNTPIAPIVVTDVDGVRHRPRLDAMIEEATVDGYGEFAESSASSTRSASL